MATCVFCEIVAGRLPAATVYDDEHVLAFLDHRPLLPGHVLVVPKTHVATLSDLPEDRVGPFFVVVQRLARAVEAGMQADGSFVAINIRISQSVPHLHVHVVPRRKGDGLKGFFWPRSKYSSEDDARAAAEAIRSALAAG